MFKISQNLLVFSKNNILSFYDTKTQKQLADYEYSGKIPDSGPVPKKNKPCESRVDNLDILYVDLTPSSDCKSAKVVVAFNDKTAKYLSFSENNITVVKEWNLAKRPTSIKILESKSGDIDVVVCDKTGDVYRLFSTDESLICSVEKPCLGHISMLLDLVLTEEYLITAERDEKIKISNRKRPVDIHGYLLGHTQFVKTIFEVDGFLVSFAGDYELKLWDLKSCEELDSYTLPNTTLHIFQCASSTSHFTAITRDRELIQFSMNGTTKKLEKMEKIKKNDDLTSRVFCGDFSEVVPTDFMTGEQDFENFDTLFKVTEFTKY